jgi:hypothetical protein
MIIETVDDLSNTLADWLGIYGCCKSNGDEGCEFKKDLPFCCRMGFVGEMTERITTAVENDKKLESVSLKT